MTIQRIGVGPAHVGRGRPRRHDLSGGPGRQQDGRRLGRPSRPAKSSASSTACSAQAGSDKTQTALRDDLSARHLDLRRDECGLGRLGRARAIRRRARRSKPNSPRRNLRSRSPASPPNPEEPPLTATVDKPGTPAEAVDVLVRRYDDAVSALRGAVERFLRSGVAPSPEERARFRYPRSARHLSPRGAAALERARLRQILGARRLFHDDHPARRISRLSARAARAAGQRIRRRDGGRDRRTGDRLPLRVRERRRTRARRRHRRRSRAAFSDPLARRDRRRNRRRPIRNPPRRRAAARAVRRRARRLFAAPARALHRLRLARNAALGAADQLSPLCRSVRALGPGAAAQRSRGRQARDAGQCDDRRLR